MKKIILVDDDPGILDATKLLLERAGYVVMAFSNADALLDGSYEYPDLYILDKQLSGIDGLDVCRHLKSQENTKHIPVIMLSASPQIKIMAKAYYADAALEKPFKIHELRELVLQLTTATTEQG